MRSRGITQNQIRCIQEQHVQVSVQMALTQTPSEWTMEAAHNKHMNKHQLDSLHFKEKTV